MTDPIAGQYGELVLTAWYATAPDTGRDAAFLLLATPDERAPYTMPLVAQALGLRPQPGSLTPDVTGMRVRIDADLWLHLEAPGGVDYTRPVTGEWVGVARADGRVVVMVGYEPMPAHQHPDAYTDRLQISDRFVIGIVPLR